MNPTEPKDGMVDFTVQTQLFDVNTVDYVTVERKESYKAIESDSDFVSRVPDEALRLELYKIGYEIVLRRKIKASTDLDPHSWIVKATGKNFEGVAANDKHFNQTVNGLMASSLTPETTPEERAAIRQEVIDIIKASPLIIAQLRKKAQSTPLAE